MRVIDMDGILMRMRKSRDGKALIKNFGYLSLLEIISKIFPLITTPYLARVLGVDCFGLLAIGAAVVTYFECLTNYGFTYTSVREAARCRNDTVELSRIYSETIYSKTVLMLFSIIILILCIIFIPYIAGNALVVICTFLLIPGTVLNVDWMFQALEEMKFITIRSIATKFIFTVLVFVLIHKPEDYLWEPVLIALGTIIPSLWGMLILKKRYNVKLTIPPFTSVIGQLKDGFNMFISLFLPTIYTQLNTLCLGYYKGNYATGIYSGGERFTSLIYNMLQVASRTVYPFFSRRMDKHQLYTVIILVFSGFVSIIIFIFAKPLVMLFLGVEFTSTVSVLRIVAITPVFMSLTNCYGFNFLVLKGREDIMRNVMIFVTIVGLVLGVIGAIEFSFVGVAIASTITQGLRALFVTYFALKIKRRNQ